MFANCRRTHNNIFHPQCEVFYIAIVCIAVDFFCFPLLLNGPPMNQIIMLEFTKTSHLNPFNYSYDPMPSSISLSPICLEDMSIFGQVKRLPTKRWVKNKWWKFAMIFGYKSKRLWDRVLFTSLWSYWKQIRKIIH